MNNGQVTYGIPKQNMSNQCVNPSIEEQQAYALKSMIQQQQLSVKPFTTNRPTVSGFGLIVQQSTGFYGNGIQPGNPALLYGNPTPILAPRMPIPQQYNGPIYQVSQWLLFHSLILIILSGSI